MKIYSYREMLALFKNELKKKSFFFKFECLKTRTVLINIQNLIA